MSSRAFGARIWSALVLVLLAAAATGCGSSSSSSSSANSGANAASTTHSQAPVRIAVFLNSSTNTYYQANLAGAKAAAAKFGGHVVKVFDANFTATTQATQIQDAVTAGGYKVFLIAPTASNVIVPQVTQAVKSGIKVACMLSPCGPNPNGLSRQIDGLVTYVGYSFTENAQDIAKAVVQACGSLNPCNVVYEPGNETLPAEVIRTKAFNSYLAGYPHIKILGEPQGQYLAGPGRAAMANALAAHPNINVAASSGDQMTLGMAQAVASAGDAGKIKLVGNGASVPGVAAVAAGKWYATVANVPYTEGYLAAQYAIEAAKGKPISAIPGYIDDLKYAPNNAIITKSVAATFRAQWAG